MAEKVVVERSDKKNSLIEEYAESVLRVAKKYGWFIAVGAFLWLCTKKVWFWFAVPYLLCKGLSLFVEELPVIPVMCLWIVGFYLLTRLVVISR